jgi:hypothetical protein
MTEHQRFCVRCRREIALFGEAQRELPSVRDEAPETIDAMGPLLAYMRTSVQRIAPEGHS